MLTSSQKNYFTFITMGVLLIPAEMVTRLFKWGKDCETGGEVNFAQVALYLDEYCPPEEMMAFLNKLANKLINVPKYLQKQGCPKEILNFPAIGFNFTEQKLQRMGVINAQPYNTRT
jgi:serine/threonine-protein kinase HipA